MTQPFDLLLLLESVARLSASLPPDLLYIQAGGLDRSDPPELIQFRLHNTWLNTWHLLDAEVRTKLAREAGFESAEQLLIAIVQQAVLLGNQRLARTYGDSAKVDGLHRRALAEEVGR